MRVRLSVLSSPPQWVSGGDARIHVRAAPGLRDKLVLVLNGQVVNVPLKEVSDGLEGVVSGLQLGDNLLEVKHRNANVRDAIKLTNWPITGPDVYRATADALRLHDDTGRRGRQPLPDSATPPGYKVTNAQGQVRRLQPQLLDRHLRQLLLSHLDRRVASPCPAMAAGRPHEHGDAGRRPHGGLHHPARSRDRSTASSTASRCCRPRPADSAAKDDTEPVERQAALLVPGRRGDRPQPGHGARRLDEPRHPGLRASPSRTAAATTPGPTTT